jgi:hypothetical protein
MRKTLKEVTIKELQTWLKKNPHITWGPESESIKSQQKPGHHRGRYLYFGLDTETMKIFKVTLYGKGSPIEVDFLDGGEGSVLDELDRRLTEDGK